MLYKRAWKRQTRANSNQKYNSNCATRRYGFASPGAHTPKLERLSAYIPLTYVNGGRPMSEMAKKRYGTESEVGGMVRAEH